jgi:hypothetical protein
LVKEPNAQFESMFEEAVEFNLEEIENEAIFNQIEAYSRTTSLLLLMRINLFGKNASLIFELLSDDKFLDYNDIELEKKLIESH